MDRPKESDWKIYRNRLVEWRERYLAAKNQEILALLTHADKTPTEQFWDAKQKMDKEAKIWVDCLDNRQSRSNMELNLLMLLGYGIAQDTDLEEFSDDLRERMIAARKGLYK